MKATVVLLVFCSHLLFLNNAFADIYKWKDENGVMHFGDRIPDKYKSREISVHSKKAGVTRDNRPVESVELSKKKFFEEKRKEASMLDSAGNEALKNNKNKRAEDLKRYEKDLKKLQKNKDKPRAARVY